MGINPLYLKEQSCSKLWNFGSSKPRYRTSANSLRGNYSREETIQGRKLFAEIQYIKDNTKPILFIPTFMYFALKNKILVSTFLTLKSNRQ